jgi:peptidoglycan/LPS O-acetylase OafA/YrhL
MNFIDIENKYRKEIDGLRAFAVIPVILFHFGLIQNGFLGVDVFFVISGFLITGIISKEIQRNEFSLVDFYLRRTRRIMPLALVVTLAALILGIVTMLPDDLDSLAQSVVASNFFANNILLSITVKNYWDVVNEFKPLMHTWSLGVEEQFYLIFPLILLTIYKVHNKYVLIIISIISFISLALYITPIYEPYEKFFHIAFRFWELAVGGMASIILNNKLIQYRFSFIPLFMLTFILFVDISFLKPEYLLIVTVFLTALILSTYFKNDKFSSLFITNKFVVFIGKISFSLYLWHQVVLAYARYVWKQDFLFLDYVLLTTIILALSILSYKFIESYFRDKSKVKNKVLISFVVCLFVFTTSISLAIYSKAGVLRDVPTLEIEMVNAKRSMHEEYNHNIYSFNRDFVTKNKIKVLAIGNSFARDWVNVLLESRYKKNIEISYIYNKPTNKQLIRIKNADFIFIQEATLEFVKNYQIPMHKLWVLGTKSFGVSNGVFYNYQGPSYFSQRTKLESGVLKKNNKLKRLWGSKYIDFIDKVIDKNEMVPVFTPTKLFISQDTRHFTRGGAEYYSILFDDFLKNNLVTLEKTTSL